jgi:hypothetical protein
MDGLNETRKVTKIRPKRMTISGHHRSSHQPWSWEELIAVPFGVGCDCIASKMLLEDSGGAKCGGLKLITENTEKERDHGERRKSYNSVFFLLLCVLCGSLFRTGR